MSNALHQQARPYGGWSLAVATDTTHRLHERYLALAATLDVAAVTLIVREANGIMGQTLPLSDEYKPFAIAEFSAGSMFGMVCVVFPFCDDKEFEDGSMTDRSVSVHTAGEVPNVIVDEVVTRLLDAMPQPPPPSLPDEAVLAELI